MSWKDCFRCIIRMWFTRIRKVQMSSQVDSDSCVQILVPIKMGATSAQNRPITAYASNALCGSGPGNFFMFSNPKKMGAEKKSPRLTPTNMQINSSAGNTKITTVRI